MSTFPSGTLVIDGVTYPYKDGVLKTTQMTLLISTDKDFAVNDQHAPMGGIIDGILVPMLKLSTAQLDFLKKKYGF